MNLNKLKPAWAYYKQIQSLEKLSRQDILDIIDSERTVGYQRSKFISILPSTFFFFMMLFFFPSC